MVQMLHKRVHTPVEGASRGTKVPEGWSAVENPPSPADLFLNFLRLGLTAFGGPSMVAYIRGLAVERKGWLTAREFSEGVGFCQLVPGATAMQTAAYVGLYCRGVPGAAASYIGFGLPAFCLMLFFAIVYAQTGNLPPIAAVFSGLQAVVVAIVSNAAISFGKTTLKNWKHWLIAILSAALFWRGLNPLYVILIAAGAGWLLLARSIAPETMSDRQGVIPFYKRSLVLIFAGAGAALALLYFLRPDLLRLALLMFKIDLLAFGGGFASVPIMYHEVVDVNGWIAGRTFMNGIVLGQATPGPVVITATFIGYLLTGFPGAVVATVSVFLPSFLIVVGLSPFYGRLASSQIFRWAIHGVLCSFVGLLVFVALRFGSQVHWDLVHVLLAAGALIALLRKVDLLWVVLAGVTLSLVLIRV
jgi:chromate transporter